MLGLTQDNGKLINVTSSMCIVFSIFLYMNIFGCNFLTPDKDLLIDGKFVKAMTSRMSFDGSFLKQLSTVANYSLSFGAR